ncbi:hypothetical protein [Fluviicola sp.]|uniref:hypothetical protein n=1 Tax=Fluviicola sp. TaxID=1917219 RepID=UPI0031D7FA3B
MEHTILAFLKFGNLKNMTDLFNNGTIYMNPIQYFRKIEDAELRGDKYEGASGIINSTSGNFKIPGIEQEFNFQHLHLIESYKEVVGNIYSLYSISSHGFANPLGFKLDQQNERFGTHCVMIKDNAHFLKRIEEELKKRELHFHHGFIEYYDKKIKSGKVTLFEKPKEFEYQKEFRFYVEHTEIEPLVIQIGSLENCAQLITMEEAMSISLGKGG